MGYQIRYNRTTNHIEGIPERTIGTGLTYATSACGALSRGAIRMGTVGPEHADLAVTLAAARSNAAASGRKLCRNCERAAEAAIASAADIAERQAASDAAQAALAAKRAAHEGDGTTGYQPTPEAAQAEFARVRADNAATIGQVYKVENPLTGAVEFPIAPYGRRLYAWVGYYRNSLGQVRQLGWSNADTEAAAIAEISRYNRDGSDYAVAPAHTTTLGEAKTYLARRAQLAPTDAKRAKWARIITDAAIDHIRTGADALEVERTRAREHLDAMVDRALADLADKYDLKVRHSDYRRRILTRADNAARMMLILERDLDNHGRPEAIEHRLTQCLGRRDALIRELEAVTPW